MDSPAQKALRRTPRRSLVDDASHGIFPIVLVPDKVMDPRDQTLWIPDCEVLGTAFAIGNGRLIVTAAHVIADWEKNIKPHRPDTQLLKLGLILNQGPPPIRIGSPLGPALLLQPPLDPEITHLVPVLIEVKGIHYLPIPEEPALPQEDLALLLLDPIPDIVGIRPLRLATESGFPGDDILVMGFPNGRDLHRDFYQNTILSPSVSRGIISAVFPVPWMNFDSRALFQIDAIVRQGSSGAPVLDAQSGDVLGVVISSMVETMYPVTIPHSYVKSNERIVEIEDELAAGKAPVVVQPLEQSLGFSNAIDVRVIRRLIDSAPSDWPRDRIND